MTNNEKLIAVYTKKYNEANEEYMNLEDLRGEEAKELLKEIDRFKKILLANGVDVSKIDNKNYGVKPLEVK